MYKLVYSPEALEDLIAIKHAIINLWDDDVATETLKKLIMDIKGIAQFPFTGVNLGELIDVPTDYRYLVTSKNYVFYHVDKDVIKIVRVLNHRQDFMFHLFE
ncbi:MAG: type II toxin-antitoxin system RelE/ParE family toxin [Bacillota bacterium]|nr:type II toxin-antitoxin system RelE/ParE family toxin [Bacillota bacterium]